MAFIVMEYYDDGFEDFLKQNPRERKRRDLVVEYAEAKGGIDLEYVRRLLPAYWGLPPEISSYQAEESLGLSGEEANRILAKMFRDVLPTLWESPEYKENPPNAGASSGHL
ncbi:MAG TPA: hypothetical protein VM328_01740 [Fimbriimonadaceae bacterium]|nr:hypothetical protein [Fimbriimonadaceae bacterium]